MNNLLIAMGLPTANRFILLYGLALFAFGITSGLTEQKALHQQIDLLIAQGTVAPPTERADDAEFLRRVFLDLTGSIPKTEETRRFLSDSSPNKRTVLVDQLLARPEHFTYLATTFDLWLMERRRDVHVKSVDWKKYLAASFAAGKPYHKLVGELLTADGTDAKNREAARFYLGRLGEPNLLTRDVGRIFFGQDLQCAQCHDHPNISDYLQRDYYGMFAFFSRTYLFQPDRKKPAVLAEKAIGGGEFKSVFTEVEAVSQPQLLHSSLVVADPEFDPGEEYKVKPDPKNKNLKPVPRYSRREQIAKAITETDNPAFNRNIANRLWAHMMGRGLVEPLDFHHASNPPSHPELLELLGAEFSRMNYDVDAFLRELALTQTYQRKFEMPSALTQQAEQVQDRIPSLEAEATRLMEASQNAATLLDEAKTAWNEARIAALVPENALEAARKKENALELTWKKANDALVLSKTEVEKLISTTIEGKPDPKLAKLQAATATKQKAADDAKAALETAAAETAKLGPPVEAEQKKVAKITLTLDRARTQYNQDKTAWKLAQRKLKDAEELIVYTRAVSESKPALEKADRLAAELEIVEREAKARAELADTLQTAADSAQAARAELSDDEDLVIAAAVLGNRSAAATAKSLAAAKSHAEKKAEADAAESTASKLREKNAACLESLTGRWADAFAVGSFAQLSPEQLCAAMLEATGEVEKYFLAGEADFTKKLAAQEAAKKKPVKAAPAKKGAPKKPEPVLLKEADREKYVRDYVATRIEAVNRNFVSLFGGQAGSPQNDFFATADQALFLTNNGTVRAWLRPSGQNLGARLLKIEDPAAFASELYLSILTRPPSEEELARVTDYLAARAKEKSQAIQELSWALLTSAEFRFKH